MEMKVTTNAAKIVKRLGVAKKQVPFVMALALTRVAQASKDTLQQDVVARYVSRRKWVPNSIRVVAAKKGPHPEARVGTLYGPMALHVEGGDKEAKDGGLVAVPLRARRQKKAVTSPSKFPAQLLQKKGFFAAPLADGRAAIWQRMNNARRGRRLWWVMEESVDIPPTWPWADLVEETTDARLLAAFREAWAKANESSR
jgi:hypothetical protein